MTDTSIFIKKLENLCSGVSLGQISIEDFKKYLIKHKENFKKIEKDLKNINIPADMLPEVKEEMSSGLNGIAKFLAGLELMEKYASQRELKILDEGLKACQMGHELVFSALKANWIQFKAFQESVEEFLKQQNT